MNNLDSIRFKLPFENISSWSMDRFNYQPLFLADGYQVGDKYRLESSSTLGLKTICIDRKAQEVDIELSAKILSADYIKGINKNTVDQVEQTINASGTIKLKPNSLIDHAELFRCDVTDNIKVSKPIPKYISSLNLLTANSKYESKIMTGYKQGESVIFKNRTGRYKERLTCYDKAAELMLTKNKDLCRVLGLRGVDTFQGVLRVEQNIVQYKMIREKFNVPDTRLAGVLNSELPANYNFMTKLVDTRSDNQMLKIYNGHYGATLEKIFYSKGLLTVWSDCGFNMDIFNRFLKDYGAGKQQTYRWRERLKECLRQSAIITGDNAYLTELLGLLKAA